jgi:hypothetical protein
MEHFMRHNPFPFPTHDDVFGKDLTATLVAWVPIPTTDARDSHSRYSRAYFRAVIETVPGKFMVLSIEHHDTYEVVATSGPLTYHEAIKIAIIPIVGENEFPSLPQG